MLYLKFPGELLKIFKSVYYKGVWDEISEKKVPIKISFYC